MKKLALICMVLLLVGVSFGVCPSADLTGDCKVNLADFAVFASQWLTEGIPGLDGMVFVTIPAGTFDMGDSFSEGSSGELPVHTVTLSSFKMSKYEITNAQYAEFLNSAYPEQIKVVSGFIYAVSDTDNSYLYCDTSARIPYSQIDFSGGVFTVRIKGGRDISNDPIVNVTWYGAKAFCDYYDYKLPTEAQWEYAARGGLADKRFPWGDAINHDHANYMADGSNYTYDTSPYSDYTFHPTWNDGILPYTSPVGSFAANGYGLYDMTGNVCEWCSDWYGGYSPDSQINPTGSTIEGTRVIRGGSWYGLAYFCRVAYRISNHPFYRDYSIGFRVCLDQN